MCSLTFVTLAALTQINLINSRYFVNIINWKFFVID